MALGEASETAGGFSSKAVLGGHPVWAHFTNPRTTADGKDRTIVNELVRLIDAAPSGSTIKGTIHSITLTDVATALVNARDRGVRVQLVIDGKNVPAENSAAAMLAELDTRFCTQHAGRACISTSPDGDMHTKMFTFTETTDPDGTRRTDVTWFGSANLTNATGLESHNNTITVYGDKAVTSGLNANFADLYAGKGYPDNDYYDSASGRGYYQGAAADLYASPEASGQTDTIVTRLNDVTPDADCRLRIGMASITAGRPELVKEVKRYRAGGCAVWMVVGTNSAGDISMTESVYRDLLGAGVKIRRQAHVHDKFFMVRGSYDGVQKHRVYTGAQNWTQDALSENDEIFVKMAPESGGTQPLYDGYYTHFNNMYNDGRTCSTANYPCT